MAYGAHLNGQLRSCSATTVVDNQSSVYINGQLVAVKDSIDSHGAGQLIPTGSTVIIENKEIIVHTPDHAQPDNAAHPDPMTAEGSGSVFAY